MGGTGGNGGKMFSRDDSSENFEKLSSSQFNSMLNESEYRSIST